MGSICSKESKLEVLVVPFSLIPVFLAPSPPHPGSYHVHMHTNLLLEWWPNGSILVQGIWVGVLGPLWCVVSQEPVRCC